MEGVALLAGMEPYSADAVSAATFHCLGDGATGTDASGCAFVALCAASAKNGTVLVFYDQLPGNRGYRPAIEKHQHAIYALTVRVNETVGEQEYEAKVAAEQKRKEGGEGAGGPRQETSRGPQGEAGEGESRPEACQQAPASGVDPERRTVPRRGAALGGDGRRVRRHPPRR